MRPPWAAVAAVCAVVLGVPVLVHGLVAAPENVTVQCSDHKPRVFWNYSSRVPTEFTVQFRGSGEHPSENKTVDHELDLRDLVWRSQKQMLDYMFIYITAGQRSNQSTRSPSFSYNKYKTADVKCSLMFPRGNLSVDGSGATLTLKNPLHIYKELEVIEGSCLDITVVIKNYY
ncbi:interferon gamma receptor 1-like [Eucyclogobius newberryi]|uniref:interferon gamma receptor 1-like n=1 Tax=Eucyclogobius newberryi TaxID=166745 RepID=UPI003B5AD9D0